MGLLQHHISYADRLCKVTICILLRLPCYAVLTLYQWLLLGGLRPSYAFPSSPSLLSLPRLPRLGGQQVCTASNLEQSRETWGKMESADSLRQVDSQPSQLAACLYPQPIRRFFCSWSGLLPELAVFYSSPTDVHSGGGSSSSSSSLNRMWSHTPLLLYCLSATWKNQG